LLLLTGIADFIFFLNSAFNGGSGDTGFQLLKVRDKIAMIASFGFFSAVIRRNYSFFNYPRTCHPKERNGA
jgi:hypothetical protein